jgi:tRNA pseudouridine38-40 synthase
MSAWRDGNEAGQPENSKQQAVSSKQQAEALTAFCVLTFMNLKLLLQYDGTDFHGWQIQEGLRTVQGELTRVLSLLEDREVVIHGSGRTDAGVHAEGQVANVDLRREMTPHKLRNAINGNLPPDVRVMFADNAPKDFHARHSARSKTYTYYIVHSQVTSPFWSRYALQEARPLDLGRMRLGAKLFLGQHDWTAFSAAQSDAESRIRNVLRCDVDDRWSARGRCHLIAISITANGFLRYMVRSIAGTLLAAARGEIDQEVIARAIREGRRELVGPTASAHGLTLKSVQYD